MRYRALAWIIPTSDHWKCYIGRHHSEVMKLAAIEGVDIAWGGEVYIERDGAPEYLFPSMQLSGAIPVPISHSLQKSMMGVKNRLSLVSRGKLNMVETILVHKGLK